MNHSVSRQSMRDRRFRASDQPPTVLLVAMLVLGIAGRPAIGQGKDSETGPASDVQAADDGESPNRVNLADERSPEEVLKGLIRRFDQSAESLRKGGRIKEAAQHAGKADSYRRRLAKLEKNQNDPDNLVTNGSFERRQAGTPPIPYREFRPGQKDLIGWEITGDNIDWIGPTRWQPAHGTHSLDLDGPRSGIQQTLETVPGKPYRLQFRLAGNVEGGPAKRNLHVIIDDVVLDFAFDVTGKTKQDMGWVSKEIVFTAASETTRLAFVNPHAESTRFGVALDHIVVRPVDLQSHPATPIKKVERHSAAQTPAASPAVPAAAAPLKPQLAALRHVERLGLRGRQVSDLSSLAELKNLRWLSLYGTQVSDLAPLAKLADLGELYISGDRGTPIRDIGPLAELRNLKILFLHSTQTSDLTPLAKLENLRELNILSTWVNDLAPLAGLKNLKQLGLRATPVRDLAPLAKLENLQELNLAGTQISDLAPLARLKKLKQLDLRATPVRDLMPLASLKNLERLDLSQTPVRDLGPLAHLENLQVLDLALTQISDLTPLASLANLERLDLVGTKVRNLSPLAKLENLQSLDLLHTPVTDVAPLASVKNLRFVFVGPDYGQINTQQVYALEKALPNCVIRVEGIEP